MDRGLPTEIGAWTIAVIGLFNILGSVASGWLADRMPKRYLLALIYFARSLAVLAFISLPTSPASTGRGPTKSQRLPHRSRNTATVP